MTRPFAHLQTVSLMHLPVVQPPSPRITANEDNTLKEPDPGVFMSKPANLIEFNIADNTKSNWEWEKEWHNMEEGYGDLSKGEKKENQQWKYFTLELLMAFKQLLAEVEQRFFSGDPILIYQAKINLGNCLASLNDLNAAMEQYCDTLGMACKLNNGHPAQIANLCLKFALEQQGNLLEALENHDQSRKYAKAGQKTSEEQKDAKCIFSICIKIAEQLQNSGKITGAIDHYLKCHEIITSGCPDDLTAIQEANYQLGKAIVIAMGSPVIRQHTRELLSRQFTFSFPLTEPHSEMAIQTKRQEANTSMGDNTARIGGRRTAAILLMVLFIYALSMHIRFKCWSPKDHMVTKPTLRSVCSSPSHHPPLNGNVPLLLPVNFTTDSAPLYHRLLAQNFATETPSNKSLNDSKAALRNAKDCALWQHPSCERVITYRLRRASAGFGSELNNICVLAKYAADRNTSLTVGTPEDWNYGSYLAMFEPLSLCPQGETQEEAILGTLKKSDDFDTERASWMSSVNELVRPDGHQDTTDFPFHGIVERFHNVWVAARTSFKMEPETGKNEKLWIARQVARFAFRVQPALIPTVMKILHSTNPRMRIDEVNGNGKYVGMHVRRGDKISTGEAKPLELRSYIDAVRAIDGWDSSIPVLVATDDDNVLRDLRVAEPTWHFQTLNFSAVNMSTNLSHGHNEGHFNSLTLPERQSAAVRILAEVVALARASWVVLTFTSNIGVLVQMLRSQPPETAIGLDGNWHIRR